jgi:hypothetical protein
VHGHETRLMQSWADKTKYLALLVPMFGIVELGAHVYFSRRAPTDKEWADVRPLVASWYKPADVVVVAPYWAEPMARWKFGDDLMPLRDVARPDATRYPEAIEVSAMGSRSPELDGWRVVRETKQGKFTVRALANPAPPSVTYVFGDHVSPDAMEANLEKGGATAPCAFTATATVEGGGLGGPPIYPASRFACAGESSYVFVGLTVIDDEQAHPRRCIWAHPPGGDGEIVARFRGVPLGTKIHGHAGAGWLIERNRSVPPFTIRVVAGTSEVGRFVHEPGDGWKGFELPLGPLAGSTSDVEFRVSAPGGGTHVCFEADSR